MSVDDVAAALHQLAEVLQTQRSLGGALAGIAETATTSVPGCDAATIAISVEGRPITAAMTARVALELDMVQYDTDEGPCLTTFATMQAMRLDLAEGDDPFPHFATAARAEFAEVARTGGPHPCDVHRGLQVQRWLHEAVAAGS